MAKKTPHRPILRQSNLKIKEEQGEPNHQPRSPRPFHQRRVRRRPDEDRPGVAGSTGRRLTSGSRPRPKSPRTSPTTCRQVTRRTVRRSQSIWWPVERRKATRRGREGNIRGYTTPDHEGDAPEQQVFPPVALTARSSVRVVRVETGRNGASPAADS